MLIDFGSILTDSQIRPELTDEFGLLEMGYCQDLEKEVEFNDNSVDFLTTDGTEIVLATPQSNSYIGDQKGTFLIKDTRFVNGKETITIVLKVPFNIKIDLPICSTIRLFKPSLEKMEIEFGDADEVT